ncbi:hypothetical protein ACTUM0_05460 [Schaalia turicensis]
MPEAMVRLALRQVFLADEAGLADDLAECRSEWPVREEVQSM